MFNYLKTEIHFLLCKCFIFIFKHVKTFRLLQKKSMKISQQSIQAQNTSLSNIEKEDIRKILGALQLSKRGFEEIRVQLIKSKFIDLMKKKLKTLTKKVEIVMLLISFLSLSLKIVSNLMKDFQQFICSAAQVFWILRKVDFFCQLLSLNFFFNIHSKKIDNFQNKIIIYINVYWRWKLIVFFRCRWSWMAWKSFRPPNVVLEHWKKSFGLQRKILTVQNKEIHE